MSVDTSRMTPAEYAAFTGYMSHPVGQQKAEAEAKVEAAQAQACQASDADHVDRFIRYLEDPDMRLVTEKPHCWTSWGENGKAAILATLREGVASMRARAEVKS